MIRLVATFATLLSMPACGVRVAEETCADYSDATPSGAVEVMLANLRDEPIIVLDRGLGDHRIEIDAQWGPGDSRYDRGCTTCEDSLDLGIGEQLCDGMAIVVSPVWIATGGTFAAQWSGALYRDREVPSECFAAEDESDVLLCRQRVEPSAAQLVVSAVAVEAAVACQAAECDCVPEANGSCYLESIASAPNLIAVQMFDHPAAGPVQLEFR